LSEQLQAFRQVDFRLVWSAITSPTCSPGIVWPAAAFVKEAGGWNHPFPVDDDRLTKGATVLAEAPGARDDLMKIVGLQGRPDQRSRSPKRSPTIVGATFHRQMALVSIAEFAVAHKIKQGPCMVVGRQIAIER
jgi:hypothetical protein